MSPSVQKTSLLSHTADSYADFIFAALGKGREHAKLIYKQWYREGRVTCDNPAFDNAKALYDQILAITDFYVLPLLTKKTEEQTEKYLLVAEDGLEIEMVLIPMLAGVTLCISSQVGCKMGCAFCETGKMGLLRHLTTAEILSQVFQARHAIGAPVRSIVFMGMGEPLDNLEAVIPALHILTDMQGFGFGARHITVSTSGLADKIEQMAHLPCQLAVSVGAPTDAARSKLMPVNHQFDMAVLKRAMEHYIVLSGRKILVEYILIAGRTDSEEDADHLADYLQGLDVTVNVIPYNSQSRGLLFERPTLDRVNAFASRLRSHGYLVFVRGTKGDQIMAACGQLGNRALRKRISKDMLTPLQNS